MTTTSNTAAASSVFSALNGTNATTTTPTTTGSSTIDESGFLTLLTTQMTQQDPTAPMDTNTMVEQLAEMSTVSGITEMNSSLQTLTSDITGNRIGDAASWIGKSALVSSSTAEPLADGSYAGQISLPSAATSLNLSLVDSTGKTVYSQTLANQSAGTIPFDFSGTATDGTTSTGPLSVVVSATGSSGTIQPTVSTWSTIVGVQSPAGGSAAQLTTTLGTVDPTDVLSLS